MTYYDFTIDSLKLDEKLKGITKNSVVVIDSLAHLLYFCSGKFIFNLLNGIINKNGKYLVIFLLYMNFSS